jgi:hypothetical protein
LVAIPLPLPFPLWQAFVIDDDYQTLIQY